MNDGENFSTRSSSDLFVRPEALYSVRTEGRRGHYHYRNPIISKYYLWHIFKISAGLLSHRMLSDLCGLWHPLLPSVTT